jgi:hypothetical protein
MDKRNGYCQLRLKLVEDLPGVHWYVQACQRCNREYGAEFAISHREIGRETAFVPKIAPGFCSRGKRRYLIDRELTASCAILFPAYPH